MNLRRLAAVWHARNLEFLRDRSTLIFNFLFPLALVVAFALIFGGQPRPVFKVDVVAPTGSALDPALHPFLDTRYVDFVQVEPGALEAAIRKVERHQVDLLLDLRAAPRYWINEDSPKGYLVEKLLLESAAGRARRQPVTGAAVGYVDWLLPGILGMNMMFSCLFGVGYVVVRYRKNGVLKRFKATPLTALEFLTAQLLSRLWLTLSITTGVFTLAWFLLDVPLRGNPLALFAVYACGAIALICLGLIVAARLSSQELADGLLNLITWPMMFLSGVWFSNEGLHPWLQRLAGLLPLTHVTEAARAIMFDGAGFAAVAPHLAALLAMAAVFLLVGARSFRWD